VSRIVLVDDQVSASEWEQDLYRMAVSPDIEVLFVTVADAGARLPDWQAGSGRTMVLTGDLGTMSALHAAAPGIVQQVNLAACTPARPAGAAAVPLSHRRGAQGLVALEHAGRK
jgi:PTS system mannose-specific IIB component/fructoselysine and glucoselysine-specific PTS system IIB component